MMRMPRRSVVRRSSGLRAMVGVTLSTEMVGVALAIVSRNDDGGQMKPSSPSFNDDDHEAFTIETTKKSNTHTSNSASLSFSSPRLSTRSLAFPLLFRVQPPAKKIKKRTAPCGGRTHDLVLIK